MRFRPAILGFVAMALAACTGAGDSDAVESSQDEVRWEPISAFLGNPPNFAQLGNGSAMSVVSRAEGRGSKAGALVELFYPQYAKDNL